MGAEMAFVQGVLWFRTFLVLGPPFGVVIPVLAILGLPTWAVILAAIVVVGLIVFALVKKLVKLAILVGAVAAAVWLGLWLFENVG